ncbi:hypothetical protein BS47DRAFT_1357714 [Hydnum rufescens UP504]|uniref:Uncharacterized protein n=1 Tax=Hydnum rufescens UP504 TaxID=1448309 RepID=A0A9P6BA43_9AGAM|nr:hypothetical protein BS47DRAFT_1357714 [Hydnum rufescens UP504]
MYATTDEIQYHTPAAMGISPQCTKPHLQDEKEMCAATRNPIQEPVTAGQNKYHTPTEADSCAIDTTQHPSSVSPEPASEHQATPIPTSEEAMDSTTPARLIRTKDETAEQILPPPGYV